MGYTLLPPFPTHSATEIHWKENHWYRSEANLTLSRQISSKYNHGYIIFCTFHEIWRGSKILNLSETGHKPANIKKPTETIQEFEFDTRQGKRTSVSVFSYQPNTPAGQESPRCPHLTHSSSGTLPILLCSCHSGLHTIAEHGVTYISGPSSPGFSGLNSHLAQALHNILPSQWPPYLELQTVSPELLNTYLSCFFPEYLPLSSNCMIYFPY